MITTLLSIVAGLAIGSAAGAAGTSAYSSWYGDVNRNKAQSDLKKVIEDSPILKHLDTQSLINRASELGYITKEDKTQYLALLKNLDEEHTFWEGATDWGGKRTEEIARLYGVLAKVAPEIEKELDSYVGMDVKGTLYNNIPALANAPTPGYLDVDFENKWIDKEAEPLKWWGGKELAAHHNLDWDIDSMYDNIKAGTSAAVNAARYSSDYMNEAGLKDTTQDQVSYLAGLRNTKADAITSGATEGQRAANELLGMVNQMNQFQTNQADIANNRWDAVSAQLLADAQANINANQNYLSLGKNIFNNIEDLYANDVVRRQGELLAYADLSSADEALRGANTKANAEMAAQQAIANAGIAASRASMLDQANRYVWMWDRFYGRAKEAGYDDKTATGIANNDYRNWVFSDATGANNYVDYRIKSES